MVYYVNARGSFLRGRGREAFDNDRMQGRIVLLVATEMRKCIRDVTVTTHDSRSSFCLEAVELCTIWQNPPLA